MCRIEVVPPVTPTEAIAKVSLQGCTMPLDVPLITATANQSLLRQGKITPSLSRLLTPSASSPEMVPEGAMGV